MIPDAEELFKKIEIQRTELINEVKKIDKTLLNRKEVKEVWNIPDVLGHLVQAEKLALSYVNKKINVVNKIQHSGLRSSFNILTLLFVLYLPFKYKAPKTSIPESTRSFEELENEWSEKHINSIGPRKS